MIAPFDRPSPSPSPGPSLSPGAAKFPVRRGTGKGNSRRGPGKSRFGREKQGTGEGPARRRREIPCSAGKNREFAAGPAPRPSEPPRLPAAAAATAAAAAGGTAAARAAGGTRCCRRGGDGAGEAAAQAGGEARDAVLVKAAARVPARLVAGVPSARRRWCYPFGRPGKAASTASASSMSASRCSADSCKRISWSPCGTTG